MSIHRDWQQRFQVHRHRLQAAGYLLAGLILLLVFPFPFHGRLWRAIFDLAHAPAFFVAVLLTVFALDPGKLGLRNSEPLVRLSPLRFLGLAAVLFGVGVFGELGQAFVGRHASIQDATANAAGVFAGIFACTAWASKNVVGKVALAIPAVALLLWPEAGPIREMQEHFRQTQQMPLIASFERPEELGAWEPHGATVIRSEDWASDGKYSLRIRSLNGQVYPGSSMLYFPGDWTGYESVEMTVRNRTAKPMLLGVRILDRLHEERGYIPDDRFHVDVPFEPGEQKTLRWTLEQVREAPTERQMNLKNLTQINVFSVEPQDNVDFEVDAIRLHSGRIGERGMSIP